MISKERGEEEEDDEGDEAREGCDDVVDGELCLTEVVLVVRGRRIRVDRYFLFPVSCQSNLRRFVHLKSKLLLFSPNRSRLALVSKFFRALFSHQFEVFEEHN